MTTSKLKTVAVVLLAVVGLAGAGAATVWACGGYGVPRPGAAGVRGQAVPVRVGAKRTRRRRTARRPAWDRPAPKRNAVAAGTDKPRRRQRG